MDNENVSIIMPVFNTASCIKESIESVINQTYPNWELIIIDDNSTDKSPEIIEDFARKDRRIRFFRNEKRYGVAGCRNMGIDLAQGYYIAFLDSDDLWEPDKLKIQTGFISESRADFSFTAYKKIFDKTKTASQKSIPARDSITYKELLKSNFIGCLTVLLKRAALGSLRFQDMKHEDYILWLQLAKKQIVMKGLNIPLAYYRIRKSSLTNRKLKIFNWQWRIYRGVEKLNFFASLYYFSFYVFYGIKKYLLR